jgi:hypothetical protein
MRGSDGAMQSRSNLTTDESSVLSERADRFARQVHLHLVLGWYYDEPERIGESAVVLSEGLIGRGLARPDDPASRLVFVQQRLGSGRPCPALLAKRLSRLHLLVKPTCDGQLQVECIGRSALCHNGVPVTRAVAKDGDLLSISGVLTLLVEARARTIPPPRFWPDSASFTFGAADPFGMIGETAVMWQLRERLAEAAASDWDRPESARS